MLSSQKGHKGHGKLLCATEAVYYLFLLPSVISRAPLPSLVPVGTVIETALWCPVLAGY